MIGKNYSKSGFKIKRIKTPQQQISYSPNSEDLKKNKKFDPIRSYVENLNLDEVAEERKNLIDNSFQKNTIKKHLTSLRNRLQNSKTLFDKKKKIAKLKANPNIAKYFKSNMKKFLSSQRFVEERVDGSVIFTLEYTQELEIMPFIQKWLPDLIVLEPLELKEHYKVKIRQMLENLDNSRHLLSI